MRLSIKLIAFFMMCLFASLNFQTALSKMNDEDEDVPEKFKYFKEKYEETFETDFQTAFDACKNFIEKDISCQILSKKIKNLDNGNMRGIIKSELCIFAQNDDTVFEKIQKYAFDPPFIRGGVWTSGRMKYVFIINEIEKNKINIELRGELSGFENHASFKAHFFKSNGLLEFQAFEAIRQMINNK